MIKDSWAEATATANATPNLTPWRNYERLIRTDTCDIEEGLPIRGLRGKFMAEGLRITSYAESLGGQWMFGSITVSGRRILKSGAMGVARDSQSWNAQTIASAPDWIRMALQQLHEQNAENFK